MWKIKERCFNKKPSTHVLSETWLRYVISAKGFVFNFQALGFSYKFLVIFFTFFTALGVSLRKGPCHFFAVIINGTKIYTLKKKDGKFRVKQSQLKNHVDQKADVLEWEAIIWQILANGWCSALLSRSPPCIPGWGWGTGSGPPPTVALSSETGQPAHMRS